MTVPMTSATAERSFSTLRRIKTYLRQTMGQQRLNDVMLLHIHKERTDRIDIKSVARAFVSANDDPIQFPETSKILHINTKCGSAFLLLSFKFTGCLVSLYWFLKT
jgi:hypothetical protein